MRQLTTLIWLKWTLFRNSLRSSKAVANRIASVLGMLAALALALLIALGLGVAAYALSAPGLGLQNFESQSSSGTPMPSPELIFFSILAMCYLLWATLPLSMGASRQFDPSNLLLYPITLRKLFAVDFVSELVSLQSVFAVPAILAMGIGAGLARGRLARGLLVALVAAALGIAISKWVSTSVGSLIRRKRTRGETLLALIGVLMGLGGALFGQIAPLLFRHAGSVSGLRWTPPGAVAFALTQGLNDDGTAEYMLGLAIAVGYTLLLVAISFWLAKRAVLGGGKKRRVKPKTTTAPADENYAGWNVPVVSAAVSAIFEKELRYVMRNAQLRMMALMPLILIAIRLMNQRRINPRGIEGTTYAADFFKYGEGLIATSGILYVFLILSGLFCNQFSFEHSGMRTLILSPVDRKSILVGKNLAISTMALVFSAALLLVNQLVFRDLTAGALLFAALSFLTFVPMMSLLGNWFSIRFPKRMKFGKRMNVSGVVGLLLIPMIILLALVPLAAAAAGYVAQSLLIEYATLTILATLASGFYFLAIRSQGDSLEQRELEILEAVNDPGSD
jgi:hypothetical protein